MPSTSSASISSRIVREPRSAQIAVPAAPARSSAVTMGDASRIVARADAAPVKLSAPSCLVRLPSCSAMTAPNGMDTSIAGSTETNAMNSVCWTNSRVWNGGLGTSRSVFTENATSPPTPSTSSPSRVAALFRGGAGAGGASGNAAMTSCQEGPSVPPADCGRGGRRPMLTPEVTSVTQRNDYDLDALLRASDEQNLFQIRTFAQVRPQRHSFIYMLECR